MSELEQEVQTQYQAELEDLILTLQETLTTIQNQPEYFSAATLIQNFLTSLVST